MRLRTSWVMATAMAVCLLMASCSGGGGGGSSAKPAPIITSFEAAQSSILKGMSTTLKAVFSNGTGSIDQSVGVVTSGVAVTVTPQTDTTYTLTVTGEGGTATKTASVAIVPPQPPSIQAISFPDMYEGCSGNIRDPGRSI